MLRREIDEKLISWAKGAQSRPLVLSGARQIGKTFALQNLGKTCFTKYHYFNFEENKNLENFFETDLDPDRIINELSIFQEQIDRKHDLVIFDEIQACPKAITSLKYFAEKMPELKLASAGSLLGLHLSSEAFPVGKVELMHMYPLRFIEFLRAVAGEELYQYLLNYDLRKQISKAIHEKIYSYFKEYLIAGGMPKVVTLFLEKEFKTNKVDLYNKVRKEQSLIIESVLADIAKHSGKENSMNIAKTWQYLPSKLGSSYDGEINRFKFKAVVPKKNRYKDFIGVLDWLEKANLTIPVYQIDHASIPLIANLKENMFKLYNYDVGILARMSDLAPKRILEEDYGSFKGFFIENFIAQELRAITANLDPLFLWKNKDYEVDFIMTSQFGELVAIEVKSGRKKTATSLAFFIEKFKAKKAMILSKDNLVLNDKAKVAKYPLYFPLDKLIENTNNYL